MNAHPFWKQIFKKWEKNEDFFYYHLTGKENADYFNLLNRTSNYPPQSIEEISDGNFQAYFFKDGAIVTFTANPHSEEDQQVMKRFASVFTLTFQRYKDLQKAEAQARESQIQ